MVIPYAGIVQLAFSRFLLKINKTRSSIAGHVEKAFRLAMNDINKPTDVEKRTGLAHEQRGG